MANIIFYEEQYFNNVSGWPFQWKNHKLTSFLAGMAFSKCHGHTKMH